MAGLLVYNVLGKSADIWILPMEVNGQRSRKSPFPFLVTEFNEGQAVFSPDGRWIAYTSDESGQAEVYVRPFPWTRRRISRILLKEE